MALRRIFVTWSRSDEGEKNVPEGTAFKAPERATPAQARDGQAWMVRMVRWVMLH